MIQIAYQNKPEDIKDVAEYMAGQTEQGKTLGRQAYGRMLIFDIGVSSLFAVFLRLVTDSQNPAMEILFLVGFLLLLIVIFLLQSRLHPRYYLAMQSYLAGQRNVSPREQAWLQLPRKLTADDEWLEISSPIAFRRCSWSCVEKIGITDDFAFIHVSGCPVYCVPRRDFPSAEAFKEFGQALTKLWKDHEIRSAPQAAS